MHISPAYQEIVDFIAAGTTPQNLVDFCPSEDAKEQYRGSDPSRENDRTNTRRNSGTQSLFAT